MPSYWQREYNPRVTIRDAQQYFDAWKHRATRARDTLQGHLNVAYAMGDRERLDLFRAKSPLGTVIFIHGGYWRAFGKDEFSWVANEFVANGLSVAVLSYPHLPLAHLSDISLSIEKALSFLGRDLLSASERSRLVLLGHSAGAQLAAQYLASSGADSTKLNVDGIVCVSGVFDLFPVLQAGIFASVDPLLTELYAASPLYAPPPKRGEVLLVVGADESNEFHRQSERFAAAWGERVTGLVQIPAQHHFSVIDELCNIESVLTRGVLGMFAQTTP